MKRAYNNHVIISGENINSNKELQHATANKASPRIAFNPAGKSANRIACLVDLDNICNRRGQRGRRAWANLDIITFTAAVRDRGATTGIVFQNQPASDFGEKLWAKSGLKCIATGRNVDESVKLAAVNYALAGLDSLILVASDGGYDEVIHAIRSCGIRVELWALRAAVAKHLVFAADAVRWIDSLVQEPVPDGPSSCSQTGPRLGIAA